MWEFLFFLKYQNYAFFRVDKFSLVWWMKISDIAKARGVTIHSNPAHDFRQKILLQSTVIIQVRWWFVSGVQLASYRWHYTIWYSSIRWHNMKDHTMVYFATFITFCCSVVTKEQIIMTGSVWNNLKEHLLKALLPMDIGLCYPLLLNRTWWTLSILLRAAERSQMDGITKRQ